MLNNTDMSEIVNFHDSIIAQLMENYERQNKTMITRRGNIPEDGKSISNKWIICYKRYVDGKNADKIARENYHSIEDVDRYLGQFDRVRHCLLQGMDIDEIAHILNCSVSLVEVYQQIDKELDGKK